MIFGPRISYTLTPKSSFRLSAASRTIAIQLDITFLFVGLTLKDALFCLFVSE